MVRQVTAVIGMFFVVLAGCQSPPEDGEEIFGPPPETIPGSKGGPCGKGYANCKTGEAMAKKYRELKVSSLKQVSCNKSSNILEVVYTWKLPKLVSDGGSSDSMRLRVSIDTRRLSGGDYMILDVDRNGANVASLSGKRNGDSTYVEAPEDWQVVDVMRGGFESVLALSNKGLMNTVLDGVNRCAWGPSDIDTASEGAFVCANCYLSRGILVVGAAVGGGLVAKGAQLAGSAATAVSSSAGAVAAYLGTLFNCEKMCKIEECNDKNEECQEERCSEVETVGALRMCLEGCADGLARCCGFEGGVCFESGGRCHFCRHRPGS